MGRTQSFVHLKPANAVATARVGGKSPMLRVHLDRFPSVIGHCSNRINRRYNEDTYAINMLKLPSLSQELAMLREGTDQCSEWRKSVLNLSIFDGHGGQGRVSKMLSEHLHTSIATASPTQEQLFQLLEQYRNLIGGEYWEELYAGREEFYTRFIKNCNTKQEQVLYKPENSGSRMIFDKWGNIIDKTSLLHEQERLRLYYTFLKFDLDRCCGFAEANLPFSKRIEAYSGGSTASSIFISSYEEQRSFDESFFVSPAGLLKLVVTQVGDTKIILCDQNGIAHSLTKAHHASSLRESNRLHSNAAMQKDSFGDTRFLNNFANTRSFGDLVAKPEGLTSEPDIYSYLIGDTLDLPHSERSKLQFGGDECFICLITDGVSDLMSDQELADLITSTVNLRGLKVGTPQYVAEEVIKYIMAIGGRHADNATCLILRLPNWGNWPNLDRTGAARESKLLDASQGDRTDD